MGLLISFAFSPCFAPPSAAAFYSLPDHISPHERPNWVLRKRELRSAAVYGIVIISPGCDLYPLERLSQRIFLPDLCAPFRLVWYRNQHDFLPQPVVSFPARPRGQIAPRLASSPPESIRVLRFSKRKYLKNCSTRRIRVFLRTTDRE